MATVGLVTVLYNCNDVLEGFFKSLSVQTYTNYHLYLIDNSANDKTDELIAILANTYPIAGYTHIKNPANFGVAKGNNQGIQLALQNNTDFIILLNNDIYFEQPFLLEEMVKCAVERNEYLIIPKILYYGTRKIWMAGGEFIDYKGTSRSIGKNDDDGEQYSNSAYFNYAPTCFMLINSKVFDTVGLIDENYFVYYDDTDFVKRAIKKGFKIYYLPALEIFHKVSISTGGHESLFSIYYLNRNRIYFIKKHFSFPLKQVALTHAVVTKAIRYLFFYGTDKKRELLRGLKDGFNMEFI